MPMFTNDQRMTNLDVGKMLNIPRINSVNDPGVAGSIAWYSGDIGNIYVYTGTIWAAVSGGGTSLAGDVTGLLTANEIMRIHTYPVPVPAVVGTVLRYSGGAYIWSPIGLGTVTQLDAATGITLTPNPITTTGTIGLTIPVVVSSGGTGQTSLTQYGVIVGNNTTAVSMITSASNGTLFQGSLAADPAFTATPTLGVAATTTGTLTLASSVANAITIRPAATMAGAVDFTLPPTNGTAGFVLTNTDSAGSSAWAALPASGVTSVGLTVNSTVLANPLTSGLFQVASSTTNPITATGTFSVNTLGGQGAVASFVAANVLSATVTPVLGNPGATTGTLGFAGLTSGTVTVQPQAAAGTYNFNLPITAGTAGQYLTSQGGAGTAMTWTDGNVLNWEDLTGTAGGAFLPANIDPTKNISFLTIPPAGAATCNTTLPNGTIKGQQKFIIAVSLDGIKIATVTCSGGNVVSSNGATVNTITFDNTGISVSLIWNGVSWFISQTGAQLS